MIQPITEKQSRPFHQYKAHKDQALRHFILFWSPTPKGADTQDHLLTGMSQLWKNMCQAGSGQYGGHTLREEPS